MSETSYPTPEERAKIIQARVNLVDQLSVLAEHHPERERLIEIHGAETVARLQKNIVDNGFEDIPIGGDALLYRQYRRTFARFGGDRSFLDKPTFDEKTLSYTKALTSRLIKSVIPFLGRKPSKKEAELFDLLLLQVDYWEDITPPATPSRPTSFESPIPLEYDDPIAQLLTWSWQDTDTNQAETLDDLSIWQDQGEVLLEVILDEGLLEGWPGDTESWAPYHALDMLGQLQASDFATNLISLLGRENDWLSDKVPQVWAKMGPTIVPDLLKYLENRQQPTGKRAPVLYGLTLIAEQYPEQRNQIISTMTTHLEAATEKDAEVNGYLVYMLNRLNVIEAKDAILNAFRRNMVSPDVISINEIDFISQTEKMANRPRGRSRS